MTNNNNFNYDADKVNKNMTNNNVNTIFLKPTDVMEVFRTIRSLNNTSSTGIDDITTSVLKTSAPCICEPLCYLINMSFEEGSFPNTLKTSIVKPLFKKGEKSDMSNYRPVTLIPIISKIFEKIMLKRLQDFATRYGILIKEQFGFRQNSTTSLACFNLVKLITEAINDKLPITAIFLDMSKAFDFVDHRLLLSKLDKYGIRGKANAWLKSYLNDRHQCVEISRICNNQKDAYRSDFQHNKFGVPQGSVLGPFLFLMYINDLPNVTSHKTILFADDTTLLVKYQNAETYEREINGALNNIVNWLYSNN